MKNKVNICVLLTVLLCLSSCFESEASPLPIQENNSQVINDRSPPSQFYGETCASSGGEWKPGLLTCICAKGSVFTEKGCVEVRLSRETKECAIQVKTGVLDERRLDNCLSKIYYDFDVSIEGKKFLVPEAYRVLASLLEDPGSLVKGWTFSNHLSETKIFAEFAKFDKNDLRTNYWLDFGSGASSSKIQNVKSNLMPGILESWSVGCNHALSHMFGVILSDEICEDLHAGLFYFASGTLSPAPKVKLVENGNACLPDCKLITYWNGIRSNHRVSTTIHMRQYLPFKRTLSLHSSDFEVRVFVNPLGQFDGVVAAKVALAQSDAVLHRELRSFDGNWNLLEDTEGEVGNKIVFFNAFFEHQSSASTSKRFWFEDPQYDQNGFIPLMIIDSGISIENGSFLGRLSMPSLPLSSSWVAGSLNEYLLIKEPETHGTQMASIMLRNLPDAKLSSMSHNIDAQVTPEKWVQEIRTSGARIVNMSFSLAELGFDCDTFFEEVFEALPEVLFVVAAGNSGTVNPDTCPAKIGTQHRFKNVLTVAGSESGYLDPQSSFGTDVAKISAPYRSECVKSNGIKEECFGTSVSAAIVSNMAARVMIRNPQASAVDVARKFLESCRPSRWPITCEGPLNLKMLDLGVYAP